MILSALFFYLFAGICIASAFMVIAARNPVHSVLFLILAFVNAAGLFILLGAEFLAIALVLVGLSLMLGLFTSAPGAGSLNLGELVRNLIVHGVTFHPSDVLAFAGLFIVVIAGTGRIPVDNPATHLELTMIHEAMVLEY